MLVCLSNASRKKLLAQVYDQQNCDIDAPLAVLVRACTYEDCARPRAATDLAEPEPQPCNHSLCNQEPQPLK